MAVLFARTLLKSLPRLLALSRARACRTPGLSTPPEWHCWRERRKHVTYPELRLGGESRSNKRCWRSMAQHTTSGACGMFISGHVEVAPARALGRMEGKCMAQALQQHKGQACRNGLRCSGFQHGTRCRAQISKGCRRQRGHQQATGLSVAKTANNCFRCLETLA